MDFQEKAKLIYRSLLVILFIVFLAILYHYSENGRFTYHKEINDTETEKYVVDTRTGTIYGIILSDPNSKNPQNFSYKIELQTGAIWLNPSKTIDKLPKVNTGKYKLDNLDQTPKQSTTK